MTRLAFSILLCLLCLSCITDDAPTGDVYVQVGDRLPAFTVELTDGSTFDSSASGGSVTFIMFFDTTCPDCRATLPRVQQVYEAYRDRGVRFALISRAEEAADVAAYWAQEGLTLPYYADGTRTLYDLFADATIPRIYIADSQGAVCYMHTDNPLPTVDILSDELSALLEQR